MLEKPPRTIRTVETLKAKLAKRYDLSEKHIELLHYVMLPKALRPKRNFIMAKIGISQDQYYVWLRDEKFNFARRDFLREYFKDDIPDVLMAMKDEALAGNERAARLFLEYVDDFNKTAKPDDPNYVPVMPKAEIKILINTLQQKFYGKDFKEIEQSEPIEVEVEQNEA
jgi:hypothetical protein